MTSNDRTMARLKSTMPMFIELRRGTVEYRQLASRAFRADATACMEPFSLPVHPATWLFQANAGLH